MLEVYGVNDINRLKQMDSDKPWSILGGVDGVGEADDTDVAFVDAQTMAYEAAMEDAWADMSGASGAGASGAGASGAGASGAGASGSDSDSDIDIDTI